MWFEDDEELGEVERTFAAALQARAATWPRDPAHSRIDPPEHGYPLIAWLDLDAPGTNLSLLTVGVHLEGSRIRGDKLHNQLFTLPDEPTSLAMTATGTPQELADRAADWFEAILRRPVVRHEWLHAGQVYAGKYLFADTEQDLCWSFNDTLAPRKGPLRRPVDQLGPPDRILAIRGNAS